ncbi:MAG: hypothetical protein KF859_07180 [Phycisphaeraceae bacterium]|nr:hypothetical protein [Phycisphaeraceae bacterium]
MARTSKKKTTTNAAPTNANASNICSRRPDRKVKVPPHSRFDFYIGVPDAQVPALIRCHENDIYDYNLVPDLQGSSTTVVLMYRDDS